MTTTRNPGTWDGSLFMIAGYAAFVYMLVGWGGVSTMRAVIVTVLMIPAFFIILIGGTAISIALANLARRIKRLWDLSRGT